MKESSDFECIDWRGQKLLKESGKNWKERRSNNWQDKHRINLQHKWIGDQSDSDRPRRGKNAAMKKEETCFGRKQSWRKDTTAGSRKMRSQTRREVIAAREHRRWVVRKEESEMRNQKWLIRAVKDQSNERSKQKSVEVRKREMQRGAECWQSRKGFTRVSEGQTNRFGGEKGRMRTLIDRNQSSAVQ